MTKKIIFPCELKMNFDEDGEISVSAHYGIGSEGIEGRRGMELELSAAETTQIKNFTKNVVLPKVKGHEGIGQ